MQWRAGVTLALVALIIIGGLAGPVSAEPVLAAGGPAAEDDASDRRVAPANGPPDPSTDVLGWEAGIWHNESIAVNQSDGLNETELNATVARTMARVEYVRQLEFDATVPVEIQSRQAYREETANRTTEPTLRTFDNAKFEALLLIGEDEDSIAVQQRNTGSGVLGFYDTQEDAIVLISDGASTLQVDESVLAHELVHALQDQHFNLSRYEVRTRDNANARNGLTEGDPKLVEYYYAQHCRADGIWNGTCLRPTSVSGGGGSLANVGTYLIKFQPYSDGPKFVASLYDEGGWAAVDAAYEALPASTEQVIHPEKYRRDPPTNVSIEDLTAEEWKRVEPAGRAEYGSMGEAAIFAMLWYPGYDSGLETEIIPYESLFNRSGSSDVSNFQPYLYDSPYSAGWDGDRLHVYENGANETAFVWRLVWDSPADAREFVNGYLQALTYWGGERVAPNTWVISEGEFADAFHVTVDGDTVTIVNAPSTEQLPQVREGIEATPTPSPEPTETVPRTPTHNSSPIEGSPSSPVPSKEPGGEPTSPGQPGFGVLAALVAVTIAILARRRG